MTVDPPWRDHAALGRLLADWNARLCRRRVQGVLGGPGWAAIRLGGGADAVWLWLVARPGATLLCDDTAPPPPAYLAALGHAARGPLGTHLGGALFLGAAGVPSERIALLAFETRNGARVRLALQLFGSRGHLVLVGDPGRLLWSLHASPPEDLIAAAADAGSGPGPADADRAAAPNEAGPDGEAAREGEAARFRAAALARLGAHLEVALAAQCERAARQAVAAAERLRENLARDLAGAARGDEVRRAAEALAAHLGSVPRGASVVSLPDPAGGGEIAVELDPALTPAANLTALFHRARKADRGRDVIAARLADAERRLAALAAARAELAGLDAGLPPDALPAARLAAWLAWRRRHAGLLGLPAGGAPAPARARRPAAPPLSCRRYRLGGRWEAWVGRDAANNDEITFSGAAPDDIWLHAQGVGGSHVVLRTAKRPDLVPRGVLEMAAALAARHSQARHSELVPVVWTLRKYVRKPRRAAPGTAVYARERTLFVPPVMPAGVVPLETEDEPEGAPG